MKILLQPALILITSLLLHSSKVHSQSPDLGTAANFVLFSSVGAIENTAVSSITGNIGTDNGAITGFGLPTTFIGNIDSGNAVTSQAKVDLQAGYDQLFNTIATSSSHAPAFGSGETLFAGVYAIAAAGSAAGNLILDAQGDANAVFIFRFGGAFTTGASTTITLINGASSCNIFWIAEGAVSMAASTIMKGTLISNNGAASMGADGSLEGRLMSTAGAVSTNQVLISPPCAISALPVTLFSFTGGCFARNILLKWSTATESNNQEFLIERSTNGFNWQLAGKVPGASSSFSTLYYSFTDSNTTQQDWHYRLKQVDRDGRFQYSGNIRINKCNRKESAASLYPSPTTGKFSIRYTGNTSDIRSVSLWNTEGKELYRSRSYQQDVDITNQKAGLYFIRLQLESTVIDLQLLLVK